MTNEEFEKLKKETYVKLDSIREDEKSVLSTCPSVCVMCGSFMIPNGTCRICPACGWTSGCA